jgi:hypothetical protein
MYGPDEITYRPYSPASVKHPATSSGIGPVAGIDTRNSNSGASLVRWKTIVLSSGVSIPGIPPAPGSSPSSKPSMSP